MLVRIVELIEAKRAFDAREGAWWKTQAYGRLILADAFARIGQREQAKALATVGAQAFERQKTDAVTTFLLAAFAARLGQAFVPAPRALPFPSAIEIAAGNLDRVHRYKTDRLLEQCRTLVVAPNVDAIGTWISRAPLTRPLVPDTLASALRALEPQSRVRRIAAIFETGEDSDRRTALAALAELDTNVAFSALGSIVAASGSASPELCALACFVAARFGYGELVPTLVQRLISAIDDSLSPEAFCAIVYPMLRALRWLALETESAALLQRIERTIRVTALPDAPRLIVAGAFVALDDPAGASLIDAAYEALPDGRLTVVQLPAIRALATGATYAGRKGEALLSRLESVYPRVSDDFGTASHFCLSALSYIDTLALAHVDHFLATANVLDPEIEPLFASGLVA